MEILNKNLFITTGAFVVTSNTTSVDNILKRDPTLQYVSSGDNSDATTTTITVNFEQTQAVNRIALVNMNWQDFTIFANGTTASTFSLTSTGATTVSDFSTNSETSMFLRATSINCTSVTFDILQTIVPAQEKALGWLAISTLNLDFPRIPSSKNYKPKINPKQVTHKMSDGGMRLHTVDEKHSADIKFKYINDSFTSALRTIHRGREPILFVGFGTTTSWDEFMFQGVWPGPFDFLEFSDDAVSSGFSGRIRLFEES